MLGVELSFTWWVIFFELFVLLAAFAHLLGKILNLFSSPGRSMPFALLVCVHTAHKLSRMEVYYSKVIKYQIFTYLSCTTSVSTVSPIQCPKDPQIVHLQELVLASCLSEHLQFPASWQLLQH